MTIRYKVTEQRRQELAKEISHWLGMPIAVRGEDLEIDIFTIVKDGTLVFYEKTDSEMVERLLEHLHDCGFETEEYSEADERMTQVIVDIQNIITKVEKRVKRLERDLLNSTCLHQVECDKVRQDTAMEILEVLDDFSKRYKRPHVVLKNWLKSEFKLEGDVL